MLSKISVRSIFFILLQFSDLTVLNALPGPTLPPPPGFMNNKTNAPNLPKLVNSGPLKGVLIPPPRPSLPVPAPRISPPRDPLVVLQSRLPRLKMLSPAEILLQKRHLNANLVPMFINQQQMMLGQGNYQPGILGSGSPSSQVTSNLVQPHVPPSPLLGKQNNCSP